jgi:acetyl-CoA carboxylase biotin carboxyl carrier protein
MDLKEIQELIKILSKSDLSELRIERDNFKLTLRKQEPYSYVAPPPAAPPALPPAVTSLPSPPPQNAPAIANAPATETGDESKYITIKSPMIGTFYRSSTPDKPAFVNVGDEIKQGSVLCIIEAMKLFNEIESEHSGRIVKILSENAKPVEYDQPLFLIEPI